MQIISYVRVSTKGQGKAGNGLEAQRNAIRTFAAQNDLIIAEELTEVASGTGRLDSRPVLKLAIEKATKTGMLLVVSRLDRFSRKLSAILAAMESDVKFVVAEFGLSVDSFMLQIHAVVAQREREMTSERTRAALQVLKAKGVKLGNPYTEDKVVNGEQKLSIHTASKMGAQQNAAKADTFAERLKSTLKRMLDLGMSARAIAREFNSLGVQTARGGEWSAASVINLKTRLAF